MKQYPQDRYGPRPPADRGDEAPVGFSDVGADSSAFRGCCWALILACAAAAVLLIAVVAKGCGHDGAPLAALGFAGLIGGRR